MDVATDRESVAAFVESVLQETGWELGKVRPRGTRFDPPDWFWSTFAVDIYKDGEKRDLRLVAKGALNADAWARLSELVPEKSSGILPMMVHLEQLRRGTEQKFPKATSFVRPGFDEAPDRFVS